MSILDEKLKRIAVIGAAGKMGSGIALLLLQEMARLEAEHTGKVGSGAFKLVLVDANEEALNHLHHPLRTHLCRYAEQNINLLRKYFRDNPVLVSNEDCIDYFVEHALTIVRFDNRLEDSKLIFEAIVEDIEAKVALFKALADKEAYYFTNTSSIPIEVLNQKAQLDNRLIGFHFYNPPAVQKLLEIIPPLHVKQELKDLAEELAKRLKKTVVYSKDVAGFIGNGYFIREAAYAFKKAETSSLDIVNTVTQEYLIRPMGIFQLIDYVGIDVCQKIAAIMQINLPLLNPFIKAGVLGGQYADGRQKNGIYQYEGHQRKGIYALKEHQYIPLEHVELGPLSQGHIPWKVLQKDPDKDAKLQTYFQNLMRENTIGAQLAKEFLVNLDEIANGLVERGVARSLEDVETVLKHGFFHLYGPSLIFNAGLQPARCNVSLPRASP